MLDISALTTAITRLQTTVDGVVAAVEEHAYQSLVVRGVAVDGVGGVSRHRADHAQLSQGRQYSGGADCRAGVLDAYQFRRGDEPELFAATELVGRDGLLGSVVGDVDEAGAAEHCHNCGMSVKSHHNFCKNCGAQLESDEDDADEDEPGQRRL